MPAGPPTKKSAYRVRRVRAGEKRVGRPPSFPEGTLIREFWVRIEDELYLQAVKYAERHNTTKSQVVREVLTAFFKQLNSKAPARSK